MPLVNSKFVRLKSDLISVYVIKKFTLQAQLLWLLNEILVITHYRNSINAVGTCPQLLWRFSKNINFFKINKSVDLLVDLVTYRVFFLFWLIWHSHNLVIFWAKIKFLDIFHIYIPIIFCKKNFRTIVRLLIFLCCF